MARALVMIQDKFRGNTNVVPQRARVKEVAVVLVPVRQPPVAMHRKPWIGAAKIVMLRDEPLPDKRLFQGIVDRPFVREKNFVRLAQRSFRRTGIAASIIASRGAASRRRSMIGTALNQRKAPTLVTAELIAIVDFVVMQYGIHHAKISFAIHRVVV